MHLPSNGNSKGLERRVSTESACGPDYVARCKEISVEVLNHTRCTQEIPVTVEGREVFADPFTLVLQSKATPISCQQGAHPWWRIDGERFVGTQVLFPVRNQVQCQFMLNEGKSCGWTGGHKLGSA